GVECLRGRSEYSGDTDENHSWTFISIVNAQNVWVRNITAEHFASNAVAINDNTKWITVQDCSCLDPISQITGSRRYSFAINRGNAGSGHGWAGANQVAWNCTATSMMIENPPTARNYAIGCITKPQGDGVFESVNQTVTPRSLYLAQLADRLGMQAVRNVTHR